jgi:hypothetical protein
MIPVEGHKNLFRDENTGAIVNCDNTGFSDYMSQRRRQLDEKAELDIMKKDIDEIKSLLKELTSRIT